MDKWGMFQKRESDHTVVQGDMTLLIAIIPFLVLFLFMVFLNDPALNDPDKTAFESIVEWEGTSQVDVDTWVWCTNPSSGLWEIVSYQRKKGAFFVLNQDDLGFRSFWPADNLNKEIVTSLGGRLPNALCGVNVHVYGLNGGSVPINGGIKVSVTLFKGYAVKQVVLIKEKKFDLSEAREEITAVSFEIDEVGEFVVGSNQTTTRMRCATSFLSGQCSPVF